MNPSRHDRAVVLPPPECPTRATTLPGSMRRDNPSGAARSVPSYVCVNPLMTTGTSRGEAISTSLLGAVGRPDSISPKDTSAAAIPSAASWKSTPTCRTGRKTSGARMRMNREVRRSIPPAATRKPTVTATRATERVANSSRTKEDRKLMRRVRIVSERLAASVRRSPSSWARARPKTCRVGSPATRSAKWLASRVATLNRFATAASVRQPMRAMKTGMSGIVTTTMTTLVRSFRPIAVASTTGTMTASTSWGRYFE